MSDQILELLKEHLSGDVVSNLAALIGAQPANTETALNKALPSILAGLAEKSSNSASLNSLFSLLSESDSGMLSNLGALSRGGDETNGLIAGGSQLLNTLFGNKSAELLELITNQGGISQESAGKLLGFITPVVTGLLAKSLKIGNIGNAEGLADLLKGQDGILKNAIPSGLAETPSSDISDIEITQDSHADVAGSNVLSAFDKASDAINLEKISETASAIGATVSSTLDKAGDSVEQAAEASLASAKETAENIVEKASEISAQAINEGKEFAQSAAHAFEEGAGESRKLLPWILIAAALALVWGLLKSCATTPEPENATEKSAPPSPAANAPAEIPPIAPAPPAPAPVTAEPPAVNPPAEQSNALYQKTLADGYAIKAAKDSFVSKLIGFIESNQAIDKDLWFSMDGITFDTNKATIKKESDAQINDIAEIMKAYPKVRIKIGGYTDNTGNAKANQKLSANRADAVKKALTAKGVNKNRMESEGYGSEHPVASNDTEAGRQQNRRIDIRVTEK